MNASDDRPGYKLIERLGHNLGELWRAEAPGGIPVFLKFFAQPRDEASRKMLAGLVRLCQLRHSSLLQTHTCFLHEGWIVVVTEFAESNLRQRLRECQEASLPGIPRDELLRYIRKVADALDFLHSHKVVHRDVKPENLLLVQREIKLAGHTEGPVIHCSALSWGNPVYTPPECWQGQPCEASDQYSLAVTYAELCQGRAPFSTGNVMEVMKTHLEGPLNLGSLPATEQLVVLRALAKNPYQRYASCLEFVQALEEAISTS